MPTLRVVRCTTPGLEGARFELSGPCTLGRGPDNGIVLDEESISRRHAEITRMGADWVLRDAGSANGVKVGGQRMPMFQLTHGLQFQVGSVVLVFEDSQQKETVLLMEGFQPQAAPAAAVPPAVAAPAPASPAPRRRQDPPPKKRRRKRTPPPKRGVRWGRWLVLLVLLAAAVVAVWVAPPPVAKVVPPSLTEQVRGLLGPPPEALTRLPAVPDLPSLPSLPDLPDLPGVGSAAPDAGAYAPLPSRATTREEPALIHFARREVAYTPSRGAVLESPEGVRVQLPAGSLPSPASVSLTPVNELPARFGAPLAGPVYDLRVDDREHSTFATPLQVTLPYLAELVPEGESPVVAVTEDGAWRALDTTVDAATGTVSAEIPHASLVGVLTVSVPTGASVGAVGVTLVYGAGWIWSSTVRGATGAVWRAGSTKYATEHFAIHYYLEGEDAVPDAKEGEVPAYIRVLGDALEAGFARFPDTLGITVPPTRLLRHDVFVGDLGGGEYGSTKPGGPIFISNGIYGFARKDGLNPVAALQETAAHELVHVTQGEHFSLYGRTRDRWWWEATAAYLAGVHEEAMGRRAASVPDYYLESGMAHLPGQVMHDLTANTYYAYAAFFTSLDRAQPGAGVKFVNAVNASGKSKRIVSLSQEARRLFDRDLADLVGVFAQDLHHRDLTRLDLAPLVHRRGTEALLQMRSHGLPAAKTFLLVADGEDGRNDVGIANIKELPPVTAHSLAVMTGRTLDGDRGAKVVFAFPSGLPDTIRLAVATGRFGATIDGSGKAGPFVPVDPGGSPPSFMVSGLGAEDGADRITLSIVNGSYSGPSRPFTVRRWLLLPPDNVTFEQDETRWTVRWDESPLVAADLFTVYEVLRRPRAASDDAWEPVATSDGATEAVVEAEDPDADYVFAVRVQDRLGNWSHPSEPPPAAGFVGRWTGTLQLLDAPDEEEPEAEPAGETTLGDVVAAPATAVADGLDEAMEGVGDAIVDGLKRGLDLDVVIRQAGGDYELRIASLGGVPVEEGDWGRCVLRAPDRLDLLLDGGQPNLPLELDRRGEIRNDRYVHRTVSDEGKPELWVLRWRFRRLDSEQ